jgi:hypothetical protein
MCLGLPMRTRQVAARLCAAAALMVIATPLLAAET